jgi:hypothetical protein
VEKVVKICVIGGGNIGTLVAAEMAAKPNTFVSIYTHNTNLWDHTIQVYNREDQLLYQSKIDVITSDLTECVSNADIIFIAMPSHVVGKVIMHLHNLVKKGAKVVFLPGSGGKEFIAKQILEHECIIVGLQRVHCIARLKEYGHSVYMLGKKDKLFVSTIPSDDCDEACSLLTQLFQIKCISLKNYLAVTLTPSNPILHTSRLYAIFNNYVDGKIYSEIPLFYEDWDIESAHILFECNSELQRLCFAINKIDLTQVVSLKEYYESNTEEAFVKKIKSIDSFKGIKAPMVSYQNGYIPDFNSRYFKEDFPFGLIIIKGIAVLFNIDTPMIDKIIILYQSLVHKSYLTEDGFNGKDLCETGIPQNFGIRSTDDFYEFYLT